MEMFYKINNIKEEHWKVIDMLCMHTTIALTMWCPVLQCY